MSPLNQFLLFSYFASLTTNCAFAYLRLMRWDDASFIWLDECLPQLPNDCMISVCVWWWSATLKGHPVRWREGHWQRSRGWVSKKACPRVIHFAGSSLPASSELPAALHYYPVIMSVFLDHLTLSVILHKGNSFFATIITTISSFILKFFCFLQLQHCSSWLQFVCRSRRY